MDNNTTSLSATAIGGSGPFSYEWSDGQKGSVILVNPTITTTYSVTVTDLSAGSSCTGTDDVVVTVNQLPVISAGEDKSQCEDTAFTMTATATI